MADERGTITQSGNILFVNNALVEEVSDTGRGTGSVLISYAQPMANGTVSIELFRLNVSSNTVILNSFGLPMCICDIRAGMWIDARFSSAVTRSIPPQSNAFLISVRRTVPTAPPRPTPPRPMPPRPTPPDTVTTTGRVVSVDPEQGLLYTGNPRDINRQMRFVITRNTVILNRNGVPIPLRFLLPGQTVTVRHASFQTASIPPQTTAYQVQVQ